MSEVGLGLFGGKDKPSVEWGWTHYEKAVDFNNSINLYDTVKTNENFYIGKQWEGVQANGLPTPQFNMLKRVCGFTVANLVSDNIKMAASPQESFPQDDKLIDPVRIINEEFETLAEQNRLPALAKECARDGAVRGDGCVYTWWDEKADGSPASKKKKGRIRSEMVENTRVFFGDPNNRRVQDQPWIMISKRETVRAARKCAMENGVEDWDQIMGDDETNAMDSVKEVDDKVTVVLLFWKDEDTGEVWCYKFCHSHVIKEAWNLNIRLYPIVWFNWDYVADCYHGQAMLTGLIPNQLFVNKAWACSMLSIMRTAWPKFVYDNTRIKHLDNRVGGAIGVPGNVDNAVKALDTGHIEPQVFQYISAAVSQTEECLGATEAALGEGKAYNTSAILSLQKAASTPQELTKQVLYQQIEDLARIYLEFMAEYYGERVVDMPLTDEMRAMFEQQAALTAEVGLPPQEIPQTAPVPFDFSMLKHHPFSVKIDVGASSYYSEIASLQTLDNLLLNGHINVVQYLERIPDGNVAGRRKLIDELKQQMEEQQAMMQQQMAMEQQAAATGEIAENDAREEQKSTGYKELGEALRSVERRQ